MQTLFVILAAVVVLAAAAGGWWFWRRRRNAKDDSRLVSIVGLLREPKPIDPFVIAKTAGRVWNADLGDGENPGEDGFVVGVALSCTIFHQGRMYLINSFPQPYLDDLEEAANSIPDLRIRQGFLDHKAWFSCDAIGVNRKTSEAEVKEWYQRLAKLFAELLDENCLLIYLPDSNQAFAITEETEAALLSDDPIGSLRSNSYVPIISVDDDDPLMKAAVEQARQTWPQFVAAFEERAGENFSVKAPVSHSQNTEFIWISVTAVEGDHIYGLLANEPGNLGPLKLGSKVRVPRAELNDWCFIDPQGKLKGGFTIQAVSEAARKPKKDK